MVMLSRFLEKQFPSSSDTPTALMRDGGDPDSGRDSLRSSCGIDADAPDDEATTDALTPETSLAAVTSEMKTINARRVVDALDAHTASAVSL